MSQNLAVGTGLSRASTKAKTSVNDHLVRYVFSPMLQIDLTDRNITGAMGQSKVVQGRITNFTDCPYKIRDESSDALLSGTNDDEFYNSPLTEHNHKARFQAEYLESTYGIKGLVILESMTGLDVELAQEIEEAILPDYMDTVLGLSRYFTDPEALKNNIKKAGLNPKSAALARKVSGEIQAGVNKAMAFATNWIMESKAEIINSRNNKAGKTSHDPFDMEMYRQTGLPPLKERDIDYADAQNKAEASGNKVLAEAIMKLAEANSGGNRESEAEAKLALVETQLAEMREMMAKFTQAQEVTTGTVAGA